MLKLTTLGTIDLRVGRKPVRSLLRQSKRLALLVYLACLPEGEVVRRDSLLALLWPDLDMHRARRALRQSLFELRRALGSEVVVGRGEEIHVPVNKVECDARRFEEHLEAGDDAAAVALYRGVFLEGFHLGGVEEFEHWMEDRRGQLARAAAAAAWRAADAVAHEGDAREAVRLSRRALEIDPWDEPGWRRLIQRVDDRGDRAGAIAAADEMVEMLRNRLGLEPSADTWALIEEIRARQSRTPIGEQAPAPSPGHERMPTPERIASDPSSDHGPGTPPQPGSGRPRRGARLRAAAVVAVVLLLASVTLRFMRGTPGAVDISAVAVLPFQDLSTDQRPYFAPGVTEMIITELARMTDLAVISHTSVRQYAGTTASVPVIAQELGVDAVIEGTVQRESGRVRVTAQLVQADPERHIWADHFEGRLEDILALQTDIARAVAHDVNATLHPAGRPAAAPEPEAHEAYLRGRYYWSRWSTDGFSRALQEFRRAIELDSSYAQPWAGLANALSTLGYFGDLRPEVAFPRSIEAAQAALARDSSLSEAWTALAMSELLYRHEFATAEDHLGRAIALNPSSSGAHHALALLYSAEGRADDALAEIAVGRRLDPLSLPILNAQGWIELAAGRLADADATGRQMLDLDDRFAPAWWLLGAVADARQRFDVAVDDLKRADALTDRDPFIRASLGHALALAGQPDSARALLARLRASPSEPAPATAVAWIYDGLGSADSAVAWLREGLARREGWLVFLNAWPKFDRSRAEPGFPRLLEDVGLSTSARH